MDKRLCVRRDLGGPDELRVAGDLGAGRQVPDPARVIERPGDEVAAVAGERDSVDLVAMLAELPPLSGLNVPGPHGPVVLDGDQGLAVRREVSLVSPYL